MRRCLIIVGLIVGMVVCWGDSYCQDGRMGFGDSNRVGNWYDLGFESSALMRKLFYPSPERMAVVGRDMNAHGAWGNLNRVYDSLKTGSWFIEEQRYGADAVVAGIVGENEGAIERGLTALEWGVGQQQPDGSFDCRDDFHSASFFVEAVAHACILLNGSKYSMKYARRIEGLKVSIAKTVEWMLRPEVLKAGRRKNEPYTHRRYLVGAAIGEAGVLCGNVRFIEQSKLFIAEGIGLQDASGFNPEKQGYDCSYQAVGLIFAHRYFDVVADGKMRTAMSGMFEKAFKWLVSRIDSNGNISGEGNTRTGFGQERLRSGKGKGISYGAIVNCLLWWGIYRKDLGMVGFAERVFEAGRNYKGVSPVIYK